jgi:hypothetical protein
VVLPERISWTTWRMGAFPCEIDASGNSVLRA